MHLRAARGELADQFGIVGGGRAVGYEFLPADLFAPNRAVLKDFDFLHPAVAHQFQELREIYLLRLGAPVVQRLQQHHQRQRYDQPQEDVLGELVHYPATVKSGVKSLILRLIECLLGEYGPQL